MAYTTRVDLMERGPEETEPTILAHIYVKNYNKENRQSIAAFEILIRNLHLHLLFSPQPKLNYETGCVEGFFTPAEFERLNAELLISGERYQHHLPHWLYTEKMAQVFEANYGSVIIRALKYDHQRN